ncbi:MAG TPA: aminoacyl-tRNA hydrolase [Chlamydiales bacterium]|jgi:PTH1 family peptidyl-tRNA hydrolase|nr:aminoacyl-tRNA hydrolase [Chlamydiales bacterium]
MQDVYLIVGLGNPGKQYEKTRHNIGFQAVERLGHKFGLTFKNSAKVKGELAVGTIAQQPCLLLKPLVFMNLSGESVVQAMHYYSVNLEKLLIIVDDVAIPLGETRLRINSGSGGHNGLASIEQQLHTTRYARLRLGVGDRKEGDLASHVLGRFSEEEQKLVPALLERAVEATEFFITNGLTRAMDFANRNKGPAQ